MTTLAELGVLVEANPTAFKGIASAYEALMYGVPSINGFAYLINNAVATNYGSNDQTVQFNHENIFINVANALVRGNEGAREAFQTIVAGASTLAEKVAAIYDDLVPSSSLADEGRAYLIRPEALAFYERVATERGVPGPDGAAIVAMASILNILVREDFGMGDAVNDLAAAIPDGSAVLPQDGSVFTPIGVADGLNFDASEPEPAEPLIFKFSATAAGNAVPDTFGFYNGITGRYAHKFDFTDFTGATNLVKVAAGEIGTGDGFATDANIVLVEVDGSINADTLAANIGRDATDLRLAQSSKSVVIIDADGHAGGDARIYYVVTDGSGEAVDVGLVGILVTGVGGLAEDHFV